MSATITLTVYQHVHPGMGRQAAERFAALLDGLTKEPRSIKVVSGGPQGPRDGSAPAS